MGNSNISMLNVFRARLALPAPRSDTWLNYFGRRLFHILLTFQGMFAFALITLGVTLTKWNRAESVTYPLVFKELRRSGVRLIPMFLFMSTALGLVVIGEGATQLSRFGAASSFLGTVMAVVVVREFGPLITAMLVLARSGTANVVELGTARALGEVEALESMGIDPVHYLVMPRVIGMAIGVFGLTIYFIASALVSGYLWAFLQNLPLTPGDYFAELAASLTWMDFAILVLKSGLFGMVIAVITCYHGLAQPLQLEEVSGVTVRAVSQGILACVALDALFIFFYLFL